MGRGKRIITSLLLAVALLAPAAAHADDSGLIVEAGVTRKVNQQVAVSGGVELRTRNDFQTIDRLSAEVGARYKLTSWLRAEAGYQFMLDNNPEKLTAHADGSYNHWRGSYYGTRHRLAVSLTGDVDLGRLNVSVRERYQYTYRPEHSTTRWDFDDEAMEPCTVDAKHTHTLRSRLKLEYNIPHCKFTPEASAELYTSRSLDKTRFTLGGTYTIKKRHALELAYRYQLFNHTVNPDDANTHHVIVGYNYKF